MLSSISPKNPIPQLPDNCPYLVAQNVISNSRISDNVAVGDLIFTPIGIYFVTGYFSLIPPGEPEGVKGPPIPDVMLANVLVQSMHSSKWRSFWSSSRQGAMKFRTRSRGATPDSISEYPGVDVRFFDRLSFVRSSFFGSRIQNRWLKLKDEEFWLTDEQTNLQAIEAYLRNPDSTANLATEKDPLGFYDQIPNPMKVIGLLLRDGSISHLDQLRDINTEAIADLQHAIKSVPWDNLDNILVKVLRLPKEYRELLMKGMRCSKFRAVGMLIVLITIGLTALVVAVHAIRNPSPDGNALPIGLSCTIIVIDFFAVCVAADYVSKYRKIVKYLEEKR